MHDKIIIRGAREHNLKNISLELPREHEVSFAILDLQGRTVWSAGSRSYGAGRWPLQWPGQYADGSHAAAGLYLAKITVGRESLTRRFVRLR